MLWFKKKEVKKPRVLIIPKEKVPEFWQIYQEYFNIPEGKDFFERWAVWDFLQSVFPNELVMGTFWKIQTGSALYPGLIEKLD